MVTILPSERSSWEVQSKDIANNIQRTLPGAVQRGYERQQGLNAIDQLQAELANANGDINKIMPAIARAYTLNPSLERSGIAEQALMRAKSGMGTGPVAEFVEGRGQGGAQNLPGPQNQPGQPTPENQPPQQQPTTQPEVPRQTKGIFLSDYIPQDIGELITPEQKAKMLNDVAKGGGDVNFARQNIDDYNQGKISFNELANANVEKQAANVTRMLGFEDEIKNRINKFVPENTSEAEKNIYYNMVRPALESNKSGSFSDAWQKVSADIDNFRKMNEAFVANIPEPSWLGMSEGQSEKQRGSAKPMMKQDPLAYNIIEQAYLQKGHSPITVAKTFKPLPYDVSRTVKTAGDYKELIYPLTPDLSEAAMERYIEKADNAQKSDITKMVPQLRKEWNQDISLFNIYADLKSKGWGDKNILMLFDDVGDLFGQRQNAERTMLNQPQRVPAKYLGFTGNE
jgi:hypothetical protein